MSASPAPAGRTRRDTGAVRREQILEAACEMIFERGYEPVSMAEIGAAVGMSGPAIYRHFQNKSEILAVLCRQTLDRLIEFVGPRRTSPPAELRALVHGQIRLVIAYPKMVRVFEDEERLLALPIKQDIHRREREHVARWVAALQQTNPQMRGADLEMLVFSVVGMILSVPRWPTAVQRASNLELSLQDMAWRMLEGATAGPVNLDD